MQITNVADLITETLIQAGVKRIFGVVGDSLNGLTEALRKRDTIDWIHVRHEEVAAFAAAGKSDADDRVEKSLFQTAIGYSHPDVHISHYQGAVTVTPAFPLCRVARCVATSRGSE